MGKRAAVPAAPSRSLRARTGPSATGSDPTPACAAAPAQHPTPMARKQQRRSSPRTQAAAAAGSPVKPAPGAAVDPLLTPPQPRKVQIRRAPRTAPAAPKGHHPAAAAAPPARRALTPAAAPRGGAAGADRDAPRSAPAAGGGKKRGKENAVVVAPYHPTDSEIQYWHDVDAEELIEESEGEDA